MNECEYNNPCRNEGMCQDEGDGYSCICAAAYIGRHCESGSIFFNTSRVTYEGTYMDVVKYVIIHKIAVL